MNSSKCNHVIAWFVGSMIFLPFSVTAADSSLKLANEFVVLMQYSDQYSDYRQQCLSAEKAVTAELLVKQTPNYFGGIQPNDSRWPKVVKAYSQYYVDLCQHPTQDEFLSAMTRAYATTMSAKDLRAAIRFYSTQAGKHMIAAHRVAARNVYEDLRRINSQQIPLATKNFQERITKISKQGCGK